MLNYRNENATGHILTIEDPLEFLHAHKLSVVDQREVGIDTHSYEEALKMMQPGDAVICRYNKYIVSLAFELIRRGVPAKIDADPERRAFIIARLDTHTFTAICAEAAAYFPPCRAGGNAQANTSCLNRRISPDPS